MKSTRTARTGAVLAGLGVLLGAAAAWARWGGGPAVLATGWVRTIGNIDIVAEVDGRWRAVWLGDGGGGEGAGVCRHVRLQLRMALEAAPWRQGEWRLESAPWRRVYSTEWSAWGAAEGEVTVAPEVEAAIAASPECRRALNEAGAPCPPQTRWEFEPRGIVLLVHQELWARKGWLAVSAAAAFLVGAGVWWVGLRLGRPPWACVGCGYDLRNLPAGAPCPECGREPHGAGGGGRLPG